MKHKDEIDQFINEMSNYSVDPQFKTQLLQKMKKSYQTQSFLVKFKQALNNKVIFTGVGGFAIMLILFSFVFKERNALKIQPPLTFNNSPTFMAKRDDWVYQQSVANENSMSPQRSIGSIFKKNSPLGSTGNSHSPVENTASDTKLGYSTGGAKDINNFRENIKNGYLPLLSDITYEGLYYDYFFDTGKQKECQELFCPSYSTAISKDPFSKQNEYYMTVGLNSGINQSEFRRKNLNLIVVLDISGSMGAPFDQYYYDQKNKINNDNLIERNKKKMQIANEAIVSMLNHLQPQDRFGIVLFDGSAYEAKPLNYIGETEIEETKKHILNIHEQGSTNHEAGYGKGLEVFNNAELRQNSEYENRIIFITDAMPNTGNTSKDSLLGLVQQAEEKKIYTTFIGVGIDFNSELIEGLTKVRGANYYSVHSNTEFKKRMDEEFEYMVTPLVFDLSLDFRSQGWEVEKVYGSPDTDSNSGNLMYVRTLFPSASTGEETKGGVILLKLLKKRSENKNIRLVASYKDRSGQSYETGESVTFPQSTQEYYANSGIRKAVALTRYVNLMKNFILTKRSPIEYDDRYNEYKREGITIPEEIPFTQWERTSIPLSLTNDDKVIFTQFKRYFEKEQMNVRDKGLDKEIEILNFLSR